MAAQGNARAGFRLALTIDGAGVEVIHAVLDGIVHLFVNHLLVEVCLILSLRRQTHHAIAKDGHLVASLRIGAIGHLAHRRFYLFLVFLNSLALCLRLAARHHSSSGHSPTTHDFEEIAA